MRISHFTQVKKWVVFSHIIWCILHFGILYILIWVSWSKKKNCRWVELWGTVLDLAPQTEANWYHFKGAPQLGWAISLFLGIFSNRLCADDARCVTSQFWNLPNYTNFCTPFGAFCVTGAKLPGPHTPCQMRSIKSVGKCAENICLLFFFKFLNKCMFVRLCNDLSAPRH